MSVARAPMRSTISCARLETTTTVTAKAMKATPLCDRAVAKDVLQVQREQEELGERDGADDRHRGVGGGERRAAEDP